MEKIIKAIWYGITEGIYYYDIKNGIKNLITFFNVIWNYNSYSEYGTLTLLKKSLELQRASLYNSCEVEEDLNRKIEDISRCISILDNILNDKYNMEYFQCIYKGIEFEKIEDMVDEEGQNLYRLKTNLTTEEENYNSKQIEKAKQMELKEWNELFDILKKGDKFDCGINSWWS